MRVLLLEAGGWDIRSADPHSARHRHDAQARHARLGLSQRAGAQVSAAARSRRCAARCSAARRRSTSPATRAATAATTTAGRRRARSAGPTPTCCPISSAARPGSSGASDDARRRRADRRRIVARRRSDLRRLDRGRTAAGYRIIADNRSRRHRRLRAQPIHHPQRPALVGGDRLSQAGARSAATSPCRTQRADDEGSDRGPARDRRRVDRAWHDRARARRTARSFCPAARSTRRNC